MMAAEEAGSLGSFLGEPTEHLPGKGHPCPPLRDVDERKGQAAGSQYQRKVQDLSTREKVVGLVRRLLRWRNPQRAMHITTRIRRKERRSGPGSLSLPRRLPRA